MTSFFKENEPHTLKPSGKAAPASSSPRPGLTDLPRLGIHPEGRAPPSDVPVVPLPFLFTQTESCFLSPLPPSASSDTTTAWPLSSRLSLPQNLLSPLWNLWYKRATGSRWTCRCSKNCSGSQLQREARRGGDALSCTLPPCWRDLRKYQVCSVFNGALLGCFAFFSLKGTCVLSTIDNLTVLSSHPTFFQYISPSLEILLCDVKGSSVLILGDFFFFSEDIQEVCLGITKLKVIYLSHDLSYHSVHCILL